MAINLGSSPIAKIKLGSTPVDKVFQGTTLVWPFLTTLSGIPPIVMLNALERYVYSLTQTGKCEQNGTPTPSAPKDIMCNNGAIKVGREIYTTPLGRTVYGGTLDVTNGVLTVDRATVDMGEMAWNYNAPSQAFTSVSISSQIKKTTSNDDSPNFINSIYKPIKRSQLIFGTTDKVICENTTGTVVVSDLSFNDATAFKTAVAGQTIVYELATPQTYQLTPQTVEMIAERSMFQSNANGNIDITYYANGILKTVSGNPVVITDADGQNAEDVTVHIEPIQSGSGTPSPTNIRPISGMTDINITRIDGVVVDGTPEVLTVSRKNLFNKNDSQVGKNWNGNNMGYSIASSYIPAKKGEAFTLSISDMPKYTSTTWVALDSNYRYIGTVSNGNPITQDACAYIRLSIRCADTDSWTQSDLENAKIQLERGSTATDYQPYYEPQTVTDIPMLLSVGDYADEGEIISGTVTRKCGVLVIDGTEGWTLTQTANVYIANNLAANALKSDTTPACLCTHYKGVAPSIGAPGMGALSIKMGYGGEGGSEVARNRVYLNDTTVGSADGLINFLKAQYAAGTPVIVVYPLATETTESVTAQPIMAHAGSNTISISPANVSNINLEVKYWTS